MSLYEIWRPEFAKAIDPRFYTLQFIDDLIRIGRAWFIGTDRAGIVVEIKKFPSGVRAVHCLVAAGDVEEMITNLAPALEQWGRRQGCSYGLVESREGWARVLRNDGWEPFQRTLVKEL